MKYWRKNFLKKKSKQVYIYLTNWYDHWWRGIGGRDPPFKKILKNVLMADKVVLHSQKCKVETVQGYYLIIMSLKTIRSLNKKTSRPKIARPCLFKIPGCATGYDNIFKI